MYVVNDYKPPKPFFKMSIKDLLKYNKKCQRNLDAQTLSLIGQDSAALQLMCMDTDLTDVLGDKCAEQ